MSFFQAEDGIRDIGVTGVQTCALPIYAEGAGDGDDVGAGVDRLLRAHVVDAAALLLLHPDAAAARATAHRRRAADRKSAVEGKSVDLGGRRIIKKNK